MSYQAAVLAQITSPPQALAEVVLNTNLLATQHQAVYGLDEVLTSGLNLWLIAGRWGGFAYTPAALTLTASATNYVVVAVATGAPSVSTATTNWNDATNYVRVYQLTVGTTGITAIADNRAGPRGVHGGAGSSSPSFSNQTANVILAGPASGAAAAPTFRSLVIADLGFAGTVNGVATLDGAGKVPSTQLPTLGSGIAINAQSANYTTVAGDANGAVYHPASDTTARTFTIAANSSVAYPVGTAITFDNDAGAGVLTIAINSDTLVLVGVVGSTGSRTLVSGGQATALKVTSTRWRINGTGIS